MDVGREQELCGKLGNLSHNEIDVNQLVEECNGILLNAAELSGNLTQYRPIVKKVKKKENRPWFYHESAQLRKEYHNTKNYHWHKKCAESRLNMVKASKLYKTDINKKFRDYQNGIISKIRSLESSDPKQYFAILNKGSNFRQALHNI